MSSAGSHTRVAPEGFRTSTRVSTSNARQLPDVAPAERRRAAGGNARLADTAPAERRNSRRFTDSSSRLGSLARLTDILHSPHFVPASHGVAFPVGQTLGQTDRKSTRLNSRHLGISYAAFCLYKK